MISFGILGYGRFGKLWAECLKPYGEVRVFDLQKKDPADPIQFSPLNQVLSSDFLFILVPMRNFKNVCLEIREQVAPHTVIVDACSVKVMPAQVLQEVFPKTQSIIATHPLFGPDSVARLGLKGRRIAISPLRVKPEQLQTLVDILKKMELEILECTPEEHDQQMAKSQALVHFLGRGLSSLDLKEQVLCTPDYEALRRIDNIVNNDTWELFFDMQKLNPYAAQMRHDLMRKFTELNEKIETPSSMEEAREQIDALDQTLIALLSKRMEMSQKIGAWKKEKGITVLDTKRETELAKLHRQFAENYALDPVFVDLLFERIFSYSRSVQSQEKIANPKRVTQSATIAINSLANRLRAEGKDISNLSAGEPMVDTAHFYKDAVDEALNLNATYYPPAGGIPELRKASSEWMNKEFGTEYSAQNALVTGGGKFAIYLALLSLLQAGDEVLVPSPHYLSYPPMIEATGARCVLVKGDPKKNWKISRAECEQACNSKTRLLILNNGSNPTGILYSKEEIADFLDFAEAHDLWILADEVYSGLVFDGQDYASCASPQKTRNRVAIVQSASKTFGMTGWRLGFLFGPEPLIRSCEALQSQILTSTSIVSQWAGVSAFKKASEITPQLRKAMEDRRNLFFDELEKGLGVQLTRPQAAFYAFLPVSLFGDNQNDVELCEKLLTQAGVAAVPGSPFGREDHIRVSFGERPDELKKAIQKIVAWVKGKTI